jgi:nicotinamidase-related amidase
MTQRREKKMLRLRYLLPLAAFAMVLMSGGPSRAETIIDEWSSIKAPPAPALKAVTVDPKTTALMVMDLIKQACNEKARPRCIASIPKVEKLIAGARASGTTIIYTLFPSPAPDKFPNPVIGDTLPAVAPKGDEPVVVSFVDKFVLGNKDTGLEKLLKDKGITTVIMVGTAAHGAVLYTATAAALRGFNVLVPVDGMSGNGDDRYIEQAVATILTTGPIFSPKVTLTRTDMVKF